MIVYAKTALVVPYRNLEQDLKDAPLTWKDHFNTNHYEGNWTALPLRTTEGLDTIIPNITCNETFADHPNMALFPSVKQFIATLQCPVMSVRLLNLAAGAVIKPHRDNELSFEQSEARLHIPVITNPNVEFYVHEQRVVMQTGECWYINANLKHQVANNGTTDRVHLVVDCKVNSWLQQLIQSAPVINHTPEYTPEDLSGMIRALRAQNTAAAYRLADDLQKQYDLFKSANRL